MRKFLVLICLVYLAGGTLAFSPTESLNKLVNWRETLYEQIKTETIKGLKANFNADIRVGKASGRIIGQVVFEDVKIPGYATAEKIKVNYDLLRFAAARDIVPAITRITIINSKLRIDREKTGKLNVENLLLPLQPNSPPPPPFHGRIYFENCQVDYRDQLGFRSNFPGFSWQSGQLNGWVDFGTKDKIKYRLSGPLTANSQAKDFQLGGMQDFKKNQTTLTLTANKLAVAPWTNYVLPFEAIKFHSGTADILLNLGPAKTPGWPIELTLSANLHQAAGNFGEYDFDQINGQLAMVDETLALRPLSLRLNKIPLTITGQLSDFKKLNLNCQVNIKQAETKDVVALFPAVRQLDIKGLFNAEVALHGPLAQLTGEGQALVSQGILYQQAFNAQADLRLFPGSLKITLKQANFYHGQVAGNCQINFVDSMPRLSLAMDFQELQLANLAQNSPGVIGQATGTLRLSGPLNSLQGNLVARLTKAQCFGQPVEQLQAGFTVKDNEVNLEHFVIASANSVFNASGSINHQLLFDFQANASGIRLAGNNWLGVLGAKIDQFQGRVRWTLNEAFLSAPLKHLSAQGVVRLSEGQIGEQTFDLAQGQVSLEAGKLSIDNTLIAKNTSIISVAGQTGLGYPTDLSLTGNQLNLADLKILNTLLPPEAKDPQGTIDIGLKITGTIPKDQSIFSVDPLLKLDASGSITATNALLAKLQIPSAAIKFSWHDRTISLLAGRFITPSSQLTFSYNQRDHQLKGSASGSLYLDEFRQLTARYGYISGQLGLNLNLAGTTTNPAVNAAFRLDQPRFNQITLEAISGNLIYQDSWLILSPASRLVNGPGEYELEGALNCFPLFTGHPNEAKIKLALKAKNTDAGRTANLALHLQAEISRIFSLANLPTKATLNLAALDLSPAAAQMVDKTLTLYSEEPKQPSQLKQWRAIIGPEKVNQSEIVSLPLHGKLEGRLSFEGTATNLNGHFAFKVKNGLWDRFDFDQLETIGIFDNKHLRFSRFLIDAEDGQLTALGLVGFDNTAVLNISCESFPLDVMQLVFDKKFDGNFNANATLSGTLDNPDLTAAVTSKNIILAGLPFDRGTLKIAKHNDRLDLHEATLLNRQSQSSAIGFMELNNNGKIGLKVILANNALGLFNLVNSDCQWLDGQGIASLEVGGTLNQLDVDGKITINNATTYIKALDAPIKNISGEAEINNSFVSVKQITGFWQGKTSRNYPNFLGLSGNINIKELLAALAFDNKQPSVVDLSLTFSPTQLFVDLPNLYTGFLKINAASLIGPLAFTGSQTPLLAGQFEANNAIITLAPPGDKTAKPALPLHLDLDIKLDKNVYISMGDVSSLDLSSIFMNMEITCPSLKIKGTLAKLSLIGDVALKRGTINLFNREFTLLSPEMQKQYYLYQPDKIMDNVAIFGRGTETSGLIPRLSLVAKVEVDNNVTENNQVVFKKVIVLSRLDGKFGATIKEDSLKVNFDSFTEDRSKTPPEFRPATYSEQDIKVLLMPDFLKSLTGVDKGNGAQVNTNAVVADYLSNRLQTVVFRNLERQLEQKLGLESLTLEYNFGKDLRQAMGANDVRTIDPSKPNWRVGFGKSLFDRLYIELNYSQFAQISGQATNPSQQAFNYQLTYKLSPIWSIMYYREPINWQEMNSGYQKITLTSGFSFW